MDKAEILERVREVISDVFGVAVTGIEPDDRLVDDLGAEKVEEFELADALEDEFDIEISEDELQEQSTVADVAQLVADLVGEAAEDEEDDEDDHPSSRKAGLRRAGDEDDEDVADEEY
jgi:acyl carrier protein